MNPIIKFFHELFNPHCIHCFESQRIEFERRDIELEESRQCKACEFAQMEIARLHQLIDKLSSNSDSIPKAEVTESKVVIPSNTFIPFHVKRQQLETASRIKAAELRAAATIKVPSQTNEVQIEKLETDLGLKDAGSPEARTS